MEAVEISGISDTDRRAVITIAPGDIVAVIDQHHARIITMLESDQFGVIAVSFDRILIDLPVDAIRTETPVDVHLPFLLITTEYTCKAILIRDDRAIENAIRGY